VADPVDPTVRDEWAVQCMQRQLVVLDDLAARATDPRGWLAVGRHARSYARHLDTWRGRAFPGARVEMDRHAIELADRIRRADAEVAGVDPEELDAARAALGLRLAVIGKGGAGKTVISSTLARRFAMVAPDGVRFLGLGKLSTTDKSAAKQSVAALVHLLLGIGEPDWDVIADLEAGPTTPFERYHAFSEDVVVVVGPAWRSAMTARRLLPMVEGRRLTVVSNRFRNEPDHAGLGARIRIPNDADLAQVEREGLSPLDECPDSPAIAAIDRLAALFTEAAREAAPDNNQEVPV